MRVGRIEGHLHSLMFLISHVTAEPLRVAGLRVTGLRVAGLRVTGLRVTGLRVAGLRVTGLRVAGLRVAGLRVTGLRVTGLRVTAYVLFGISDISCKFILTVPALRVGCVRNCRIGEAYEPRLSWSSNQHRALGLYR